METELEARLGEGARVAVSQCLRVGPGESVLVVTDPDCRKVAEALWAAASAAGAEPLLLVMRARQAHGEEPPPAVAEAMKVAGVCLAPTSRSLTHTVARRQATAAGCRIASMPGITPEMMARTLAVDYRGIAALTEKVAALLDGAAEARVRTPAGTDLTLDISGRRAMRDTGLYTRPGDFGNLPAGEAYIAPGEGSARGRLVVDGSMAGVGTLDQPLVIEVVDGQADSITGGVAAARLTDLLDRVGRDARNLAELGIGTNPAARVTGNVLEDEKVLGTVHLALGANASFGGKVQVGSHLDGVLLSPDVWVDGVQIMRSGQLLLP
ncbi:MAG: aminopeptidase [Bacillota bacterium]|nr:aminopeptidase [Bacillota bacterium]